MAISKTCIGKKQSNRCWGAVQPKLCFVYFLSKNVFEIQKKFLNLN